MEPKKRDATGPSVTTWKQGHATRTLSLPPPQPCCLLQSVSLSLSLLGRPSLFLWCAWLLIALALPSLWASPKFSRKNLVSRKTNHGPRKDHDWLRLWTLVQTIMARRWRLSYNFLAATIIIRELVAMCWDKRERIKLPECEEENSHPWSLLIPNPCCSMNTGTNSRRNTRSNDICVNAYGCLNIERSRMPLADGGALRWLS